MLNHPWVIRPCFSPNALRQPIFRVIQNASENPKIKSSIPNPYCALAEAGETVSNDRTDNAINGYRNIRNSAMKVRCCQVLFEGGGKNWNFSIITAKIESPIIAQIEMADTPNKVQEIQGGRSIICDPTANGAFAGNKP